MVAGISIAFAHDYFNLECDYLSHALQTRRRNKPSASYPQREDVTATKSGGHGKQDSSAVL